MATLQTGPINTGEYTRSTPDSTPLPAGIYSGTIVKAEQKHTNAGDGMYVRVEINIDTPEEYNTRKFWDDFNIMNPSEIAAKIGLEGLADLGKAAGIEVLNDDDQLLGCSIQMELYIEKGKEYIDKRTNEKKMGQDKNKCRKYWPMGIDVEAAKKAEKESKKETAASAPAQQQTQPVSTMPANAPKPPAAKFPGAGAKATPAKQTTTPAPSTAAPVTGVAPWKRNKQ